MQKWHVAYVREVGNQSSSIAAHSQLAVATVSAFVVATSTVVIAVHNSDALASTASLAKAAFASASTTVETVAHKIHASFPAAVRSRTSLRTADT